eukprot:9267058-Pyramimonas_sp.AAC.1
MQRLAEVEARGVQAYVDGAAIADEGRDTVHHAHIEQPRCAARSSGGSLDEDEKNLHNDVLAPVRLTPAVLAICLEAQCRRPQAHSQA